MSSNIRGGEALFTGAESVTTTPGIVSAVLSVGPATAVGILVQNTGSQIVTVTIEVAAPYAVSAGRNNLPASDNATWSVLFKRDGSAAYSVAVPVTTGTVAIDLSPFAFTYLRLRAIASASTSTLVAQGIVNG